MEIGIIPKKATIIVGDGVMNNIFKSPIKLTLILAMGLMTIFIVMSISNNSNTATDYRGPLPLWISKWIDMPVCAPPCWENLTPGVSSFLEAKAAINDRADIENLYLGVGPLSKNQILLNWYFSDEGGSGEIFSDLEGEKISSIVLHTNPNRKKTLSLEGIVLKFGDPDEITVVHCLPEDRLICEIRLLYLENGLAVKFRSIPTYKNSKDPFFYINVAPNAEVTEIMLFPPSRSEYIQSTSNKIRDDLDRVSRWDGFGKYTFTN